MRAPDYERGNVRLYCGDCLELLPQLEAGSVDAVVTDPPYGVAPALNSVTRARAPWSISGQRKKNEYGDTFDDSPAYVRECVVPAFEMAYAMAKRAVVTPGNRCLTLYPAPDSFGAFFQPASTGLQRWGRCDAQPIFYYGSFPRESRLIPGQKLSHVLTESPEPCGHPCPKPTKAWTGLVQLASLEGETVLDPFMGSGTTGVACVKTGRAFIGMEIEPKYFEIAVKRIDAAIDQYALLDPVPAAKQMELLAPEGKP